MIHGKCSSEAVIDEIFKINFCTSKFGLTQSGECTLIKFGNMAENVSKEGPMGTEVIFIVLTVKIKSYITKNSYAQLKDIPLNCSDLH